MKMLIIKKLKIQILFLIFHFLVWLGIFTITELRDNVRTLAAAEI